MRWLVPAFECGTCAVYDIRVDPVRIYGLNIRLVSVMTGTRLFADARSEAFDAVFVNRSVAQGKNPNEIEKREKLFGIVFNPANKEGHRIFLEAR